MGLDDVTVLDLTRLLPGPFATQLLADLGADVLKVERPGTGDEARSMDGGGPSLFDAVNRGKRSVTLDLSTDGGRAACLRLADDADVVVESFRPGVADRLGVDEATVRERNPGAVYCSLSGFGATGPNRDRAGHDLNYAGMAGLIDMTRGPGGDPAIPGFPVADVAGGLYAAVSIVAVLLGRELGDGAGAYVDLGPTDAVLALSSAVAPAAFAGEDPRGRTTPLTGKYPCYDVYEAADGRYVTLAALEPQFWESFCEAVDRADLVEAQYADDPAVREAVREELSDVFAERSRDEWETLLGGEDVMVAPVRSLTEALAGEQAAARGLVVDDGPGPRVGFPAQLTPGAGDDDESVPDLGEHTEAVLGEHGYDDGDVAALRDRDAI